LYLASARDVIVQLGIWPCLIVIGIILWSMFGYPIKGRRKK